MTANTNPRKQYTIIQMILIAGICLISWHSFAKDEKKQNPDKATPSNKNAVHVFADTKPGAKAEWSYKMTFGGREREIKRERMTAKSNDGETFVFTLERTGPENKVISEEECKISLEDLHDVTIEMKSMTKTGVEKIKTPAGELECEVWSNSHVKLWVCSKVPFNHLVRREQYMHANGSADNAMIIELASYQDAPDKIEPEKKPEKHPWADLKPGDMGEWAWEVTSIGAKVTKLKHERMTVKSNDGKTLVYILEKLDTDRKVMHSEEVKLLFANDLDHKIITQETNLKKIGEEKIKVKAGKFKCEVWSNGQNIKLWLSDKVPFDRIVKKEEIEKANGIQRKRTIELTKTKQHRVKKP